MRVSLDHHMDLEDQFTMSCTPDTCPHRPVQVIICSCSVHLNSGSIAIPGPSSHAPLLVSSSTLPSIQDLLNAFTPPFISSPISKFSHQSPPSLDSLSRAASQLQHLDLSSLPWRAGKYIRNPFQLLSLAKRTRDQVHAAAVLQFMGLLSFQLWFNIWVVVVWLLVRRIAEIFGIKIPPLGGMVVGQNEGKSSDGFGMRSSASDGLKETSMNQKVDVDETETWVLDVE